MININNRLLANLNSFRVKSALETIENGNSFVYLNKSDFFDEFYNEMFEHFTHQKFSVEIELNENTDYITKFILNDKVYCPDSFIKIFDENICNITFLPNEKGIELYRLEIFNQRVGLGTKLMKAFCDISKKTKVPIYFIPGDPGFFNHSYRKRLMKFYSQFGFKKLDRSSYWANAYQNGKIRPCIGK